MSTAPADWLCEAYGPEARRVGILCFLSGERNTRVCATPSECCAVMTAERQRTFARIGELAAHGDPAGVFLEGEFTDPGQLLGGAGEDSGDDT